AGRGAVHQPDLLRGGQRRFRAGRPGGARPGVGGRSTGAASARRLTTTRALSRQDGEGARLLCAAVTLTGGRRLPSSLPMTLPAIETLSALGAPHEVRRFDPALDAAAAAVAL